MYRQRERERERERYTYIIIIYIHIYTCVCMCMRVFMPCLYLHTCRYEFLYPGLVLPVRDESKTMSRHLYEDLYAMSPLSGFILYKLNIAMYVHDCNVAIDQFRLHSVATYLHI